MQEKKIILTKVQAPAGETKKKQWNPKLYFWKKSLKKLSNVENI
jgi:hypothetical protein